MAVIGAIRQRLVLLARSEQGIALPTAVLGMVVGFALASIAILSSVDAQQGTGRDSQSKDAIAAADAGASVALLRLNRFQSELTETNRCIGPGGEAVAESSEFPGWCPAIPVETVGGSTFSYRTSAYEKGKELSVVSVGTAGTVSRRIQVGLVSLNGENVFANEHVIGQDDIELNGNPEIRTDIGTNGNVTGNGSYTICGNIRHGVGKNAPEPDCEGDVTEGNRQLPSVEPPENIATVNSNCRLVPNCPGVIGLKEVDTYSKKRSSTNPWDNTHRTVNVASNATLTMGGNDYWVCGLDIQNGEVIMAAGANIRIFVDTPEHCGLEPGATQVTITGNANIIATGYKPSEGKFEVPNIYLLGSGKVKLCGNSGTNELILYAPFSEIEMCGNATWIGMLGGKSLDLGGTPMIESDPGMVPPDITLQSLWERTHYFECTGGEASSPAANC
jgi:hypothetical protein